MKALTPIALSFGLLTAAGCPAAVTDAGPSLQPDAGTAEPAAEPADDAGAVEPAAEPGAEPSAEPGAEPSAEPAVEPGVDGGVDDGMWRDEPALPEPRQETVVLAHGGLIYVLGGYDAPPGQQIQDSLYVFDPATNQWSAGPPLPAPSHHINAAVVGDEIFALGSLRASFVQNAESFALNIATGQWRPLAPMPEAVARGAGVAVARGTDIYVIGGYRNYSSSALVSVYDTVADSWRQAPSLPDALDHLGGGLIDDTLVIAGGREGGITSHQPKTYVFDDAGEQWVERAPMPTSRAGAAFVVVAGELLVIGGEGAPNATGVFEEVEAYRFSEDEWRTLEPMPFPRHGMGAAAIGDRVYVPGGADIQAFAAVDVVRSFVLPPQE